MYSKYDNIALNRQWGPIRLKESGLFFLQIESFFENFQTWFMFVGALISSIKLFKAKGLRLLKKQLARASLHKIPNDMKQLQRCKLVPLSSTQACNSACQVTRGQF